MNNYQISKYSEQFAENSITINPYMMKKLGIIRTKCLIRVNEYQLACVPYSISLKACRLLLILSPKEQQIINDLSSQSIMLHLEIYHPNLNKNIPLFIRISVKNFKQLNARLNQCLLEADFLTIPQDYREIILEHFLKNEENLKIFNDPNLNMKPISAKCLSAINISKRAFLRLGSDIKLECRIIEISLKKVIIYIDSEEKFLMSPDPKTILELIHEKDSIFIDAGLSDYTPSSEVEGFFIVSLAIEYSSPLTERLSTLLTKGTPPPLADTDSEAEDDASSCSKNQPSSPDEADESSEEIEEYNDAEDVLVESESTE